VSDNPIRDRAASLFGEIAVAAGVYEANYNTPPRNLLIPKTAADELATYLKRTKPGALRRSVLISGLQPHIVRDGTGLAVTG
jgi:hypothetical protein